MENPRQLKGQEIADRYRITHEGNVWYVPSQSGKGKYKVDPKHGRCTCPDYEFTQSKCKHQYAVEFTIERERQIVTETQADGTVKTTVTETVKVTRKTYPQEWPAYNAAQTQEKELFQKLLSELCKGVGEPAQHNGRPRLPLEDMIFAMAFKVYSTLSGRRFMSDMRDAFTRGHVSKLPSYNTIFRYFESDVLTPYLKMLIEESALPLRAIESDFAVDSSGLSTSRFVSWTQAKYKWHAEAGTMSKEDAQRVEKHDWLKLHICCGVKTNVVTAVEVTDRRAADTPYFKPLVETTAQNFAMLQVSADKAYHSNKNLVTVVEHAAEPFIPFKANSRSNVKRHSALWRRIFHYFMYNQEEFMRNYHKRSNVETAFHMIKSKFGDSLRSKTRTAQVNEALCKVLCHNLVVLVSAMFELKITPTFWEEVAA